MKYFIFRAKFKVNVGKLSMSLSMAMKVFLSVGTWDSQQIILVEIVVETLMLKKDIINSLIPWPDETFFVPKTF